MLMPTANREFFIPGRIIYREGALAALQPRLGSLGKKALIVTGKTVRTLECFGSLTAMLEASNTGYEVFDGITGEPDDEMIANGARAYRDAGCDFLIGIGGGSPIDSMKAIAVSVSGDLGICDYYDKIIDLDLPKMVAIPTTAGTGSEATQFTVITDSSRSIKMLLKGASLMQDFAIVDGTLGVSAPKSVTASTGLDALTHAVEAYTSRLAQPLTDSLCISSVKRLFEYLPRAYKDGGDLLAREQNAIAALEAGIAINNSSVTIVHGMSRPIGALFHVPHGLSNAMLLYRCMDFVKDSARKRLAELSRAVGLSDIRTAEDTAADRFVFALGELCSALDVPTVGGYNIPRQEYMSSLDKMADDAIASGSPSNTQKLLTKEDIINIYRSVY